LAVILPPVQEKLPPPWILTEEPSPKSNTPLVKEKLPPVKSREALVPKKISPESIFPPLVTVSGPLLILISPAPFFSVNDLIFVPAAKESKAHGTVDLLPSNSTSSE
jgi:hypothetical protein